MIIRIIKILFVIALIVSVIFLGGAYLLPDNQYYERKLVIETDPVAVFSKLKTPDMIENISPGIFSSEQFSFQVDSLSEYNAIQYHIKEGPNEIIKAGFFLQEQDEGTELTWFMRLDSLSFPYERWKGFFTIVLKKKSFINNDEKITNEIMK